MAYKKMDEGAFGDTRRPGERGIDGDDDVEGHGLKKGPDEGFTTRKWGEGASDDDVEGHAAKRGPDEVIVRRDGEDLRGRSDDVEGHLGVRRGPEGDAQRKRGELDADDVRGRRDDDTEGHARLRRGPEGDAQRKRGEGASDEDVEGHGTAKR